MARAPSTVLTGGGGAARSIAAAAICLLALTLAATLSCKRNRPDAAAEAAVPSQIADSDAPEPAQDAPPGDAGDDTTRIGVVPVHGMSVFVHNDAPAAPFPIPEPKVVDEAVPAWWERPSPLTDKELAFQRYLSTITWRLPRERWSPAWDVGGDQLGLFTIRFYASFTAYAAATIGMRTPAYPALTGKIMLSAIEHLLDRGAWSYVDLVFPDQPWYPDPVAKANIMYSGHVLQTMAMYEGLTGDDRFRREGFDFVSDDEHKFHYDLMSLAEITAEQIRANASGGVPCEPSHVFVTCNDHAHVALRLMESLGLGDWSAERDKWFSFVLRAFYDPLGGGAIKVVYNPPADAFYPIGYAGMDGWALLWMEPWIPDRDVALNIWAIARDRIRWEMFTSPRRPDHARIQASGDRLEKLYNIINTILPAVPTGAFLYAAAAAVGDRETSERLRLMAEAGLIRYGDGRVTWHGGRRFEIGSMANIAIGLALENGSSLRHQVLRPLPRDYFDGPIVDDVRPDDVVIRQAYRDGTDLIVEIDEFATPVTLTLRNVRRILAIDGAPDGSWRYEPPVLTLEPAAHGLLKIAVGD